MRLALFGATGRTGSRLLAAALAQGHSARLLVRDPSRLTARGDAPVDVVEGDVLDREAVRRTVTGVDAVLATLGGGTTAAPGTSRSQGMRNIIHAMHECGVRRIVALGGAGVLDAADGNGLRSERPTYPAVFRLVTAEHRAAWEALRASGLAWTYVGPPDIPDGDATGLFRVVADTFPEGGKALATGDVAAFMLHEVTAQDFVGRRVGIAT